MQNMSMNIEFGRQEFRAKSDIPPPLKSLGGDDTRRPGAPCPAKAAFLQMLKTMQHETEIRTTAVDTAAGDLGEGRRNEAIGALCAVDQCLERLAVFNSAIPALQGMMAM